MAQTWAQLRDGIEATLQDGGINPAGTATNQIFSTAELDLVMADSLREIATIIPYIVRVPFTIESRTGIASTTSANNLVDTTEGQFAAADVGKVVQNTTKKTWALITSYASTSSVGLSKDIFSVNDVYSIFHKDCINNKQLNISNVTDYIDVVRAQYPIGIDHKVIKDTAGPDIIELDMLNDPEDSKALSSGVQPNTETLIYFAKRHKVSQLTDLAGATAASAGVVAGATTMALTALQGAGTIEADQEFTVANIRGNYWVREAVTIASSAASIAFYPPLESAAASAAVVTFKLSTLTPQLEPPFTKYVAGRTAISKSTYFYQQLNAALPTLAAATAAINNISIRTASATTLLASGSTQLALVPPIILTAATTLSSITARIQAATTYIAAGSTEAAKVPAIILSAATAIAAASTRIAAATTYIASGSTQAAGASTLIAAGTVEMALVNANIDLAASALAAGTALLNVVPVGGGAPEYMNQAYGDIGVGRGYLTSGQGFLESATQGKGLASTYMDLTARELNAAISKLSEGQGYLQQAQADQNLNASFLQLAARELQVAGAYLQQGQGYFQQAQAGMNTNASYIQSAQGQLALGNADVNDAITNMRLVASRLSVSNASRTFEVWGQQQVQEALNDLQQQRGVRVSTKYPR